MKNLNLLKISVFMILLMAFPGQLLSKTASTVKGKIDLYLFESGTGSESSGTNNFYVTVGDTIEIDVFIRNLKTESVTGLETYFTVNDTYFDIVSHGQNNDGSLKPFIQGTFLKSANGIVFPNGNTTHGDSLSGDDNIFEGWQLDYAELTPPDMGSGRPSSSARYGVVASFQLIAKAPCDSMSITRQTDSYYNRVSRYHKADASDSYFYKTFNTCYITVSDIEINPPLPDIVMEPGTADSTLDLDEHIGIASIPDSLLLWTASGNQNVGVAIDSKTHVVTFDAPAGYKGFEDIIFTVGNGEGISASDTMRVTVNAHPRLLADAIPDTIYINEDSLEVVMSLRDIVEDSDDTFENLLWFITTGENVIHSTVADSLALKGIQNFYGMDSLKLSVYDPFSYGDSLSVPVQVLPVDDPPVFEALPEAKFERGDSFQFTMTDYMSDADGDQLTLTWEEPENFLISVQGYQIIFSSETFIGSEYITFTATDPADLAAVDSMLVTVITARKPPVWSRITKIGFPQGQADSTLFIWDYVTDPDDSNENLDFVFANRDDIDSLFINKTTGRLTFYDLNNSPGWDRITVTAYDLDGNSASTQFLAFIGPADGTPIIGGIPDTTIVAGTESDWIDLDDFYYDIDNTNTEMKWTWGRQVSPDSTVTVFINPFTHVTSLKSLGADLFGFDRIFFTVTDPDEKFADDICIITVVEDILKPTLNLPSKVGFVAGEKTILDLDEYVEDLMYQKSELSWTWFANINTFIALEEPDKIRTRPVSFTGSTDWIGWERVEFIVSNPMGGAAKDTLIVFSVPNDGSPIAGGLNDFTVKAGKCVNIYLEDYYFDTDTPYYDMTWTVSGNDSITVSIDPSTHIATLCAPSETWEGQEFLTFTVSDEDNHTSSMNVLVTVTDAVIRNFFSIMIFRNPMQEDYMDFYIKSKENVMGLPSVNIRIEGDSTSVSVETAADKYYYCHYLLPLEKSIGIKGIANIIVSGTTSAGKAVQDTSYFAYGRVDQEGAKLAHGAMSLGIPAGALAKPVFITMIPGAYKSVPGQGEVPEEIILSGVPYDIGPSSLNTEKPLDVGFSVGSQSVGAGVYRFTNGRWNFIGADRKHDSVHAEAYGGGTFQLGFDATPPCVKLLDSQDGAITVSVADYGSGIDNQSITVVYDGFELPFEFDPEKSVVTVNCTDLETDGAVVFEMTVSDMSGNKKIESFSADVSALPGQIFLEQNRPNPFNPVTHITFVNTSDEMLKLEVYDLLGRKVRVIAHDHFPAGKHTFIWNARDENGRTVSSGTYIYRIISNTQSKTRKMLLLR